MPITSLDLSTYTPLTVNPRPTSSVNYKHSTWITGLKGGFTYSRLEFYLAIMLFTGSHVHSCLFRWRSGTSVEASKPISVFTGEILSYYGPSYIFNYLLDAGLFAAVNSIPAVTLLRLNKLNIGKMPIRALAISKGRCGVLEESPYCPRPLQLARGSKIT